MASGVSSRRLRLVQGLVLLAFTLVPAVACQWFQPPPQERRIHVQSFRYGKRPSVIRVNRGDRLRLTFESLDTGHSFFLEQFNVHAKHTPGTRRLEIHTTDDPTAPPVMADEVVFDARLPGLKGYLVSKMTFRDHVWTGPMHAFEHGNLIIEPNTLLCGSLGALAGLLLAALVGLARFRRNGGTAALADDASEGRDLLARAGWLKRLLKHRGFVLPFQAAALALFYFVLLALLLGTKVSGRNAGAMLMWVVWLFLLTAVLTPLGGRLWCMACPLPLLGEIAQRRSLGQGHSGERGGYNNRFRGLGRRWPAWLSNAWPRTLLFLTLATFSIPLVAVPKVSGWVLAALVVLATAMALVWELRAFCRYVCPISAFVGLYAMAGRLALRSAGAEICAKCKPRTCQRGDARGWACPYGLCVADIRENNDCGLCTECIKSCAYNNVTLRWRRFGLDLGIRSAGEAWLAMAMLVIAVVYCIVHLGHWPEVRDWVNILDKGNWGLFGMYAAGLWVLALGVFPAIMALAAWMGKRLSGADAGAWRLLLDSAAALVPQGLWIWIAFVVPMLFVNVTFVLQSLSDPFGWGWNLLGMANSPWHQLWPSAIPWIQAVAVLVGLGYSLRNAWRIWLRATGEPARALRGLLPVSALLVALSAWLLVFFTA